MTNVEEALARMARETTTTRVPPLATITARARRRRRVTMLGTAASASVLVLAATVAAAGMGGPQAKPAVGPRPDTAPSASASVGPTSTPPTTVPPPEPQKEAKPVGTISAQAGPEVPIVVRDGAYLDVPGRRRFLVGAGADWAVAPDNAWVAYGVANGHLRVLRLSTGASYDLGTGHAPVWGDPGLAYVVSRNSSEAGYLCVRNTPLTKPTIWGTHIMEPAAWVARALLAHARRDLVSSGYTRSLVLFDAPNKRRPVTGPNVTFEALVAVSPDHSQILVHEDVPEGPYIKPRLRLYDARRLTLLQDIHGQGFESLDRGIWLANDVYAPEGYTDGGSAHPSPTLHHLRITGTRIQQLSARNIAPGTSSEIFAAIGLIENESPSQLAVVRQSGAHAELLECRKTDLVCHRLARLG